MIKTGQLSAAISSRSHPPHNRVQRTVRVRGVVQGVGFRPYVWRLANELHLNGWVRNDAAGVEILVEGSIEQVRVFTQRLPAEIPPLARVRELTWNDACACCGARGFSIAESDSGFAITTMIGHDTAVCADCLAEVFDPANRRWRYPFTNCTHCGPRYTLTHSLPYDRRQTSMAAFPLCEACEREYRDPADRRFHAEPIACPTCGPRLTLLDSTGGSIRCDDPCAEVYRRLAEGQIIAIKGLGGFHLACDARNADTVRRLRARKGREQKPFAIMPANLASAVPWVAVNPEEAHALQGPERPIVLLRKTPEADATFPDVAPGLAWLGVMLPYTPIHWLLFHEAAGRPTGTAWMHEFVDLVLVMTSANPGGEPLVIDNQEALERLSGLADAVLMHDREIVVRCDDSVVRMIEPNKTQFIRRARGYTPRAIGLPHGGPPILALGGYLKNTICVTRGDEAFVSQHIGGLNNPATCGMLMEVTEHLLDILQVKPAAIAHDLHPDFFSSLHAAALAGRWGVPAIAVQHHHAHIAAVVAEHGVQMPVLGLALDGAGLGRDGGSWGGELLRVDGHHFSRLSHLAPLPLPGGDKAASEPWRMAAAALYRMQRGGEISRRFPDQPSAAQLLQLMERRLNCPFTTSLGRWFDAAAGLLGVHPVMAYEGQAAMALEGLAELAGGIEPVADGYVLDTHGRLDLLPLLANLADEKDVMHGAALFHATLTQALGDWVERHARSEAINTIVLGGGCFLNHILTRNLTRQLSSKGFSVLSASQAPPNDGGLSLGQAWVALQHLL